MAKEGRDSNTNNNKTNKEIEYVNLLIKLLNHERLQKDWNAEARNKDDIFLLILKITEIIKI